MKKFKGKIYCVHGGSLKRKTSSDEEKFSSEEERFSSEEERFSSEEERFSSEEEKFSSDEEHFSSEDEKFNSEEESGSNEENIPRNQKVPTVVLKKQRIGVLRAKETSLQTINNIPKQCCESACLKKVSQNVIKKCREEFYMKSQANQSQFIADCLLNRDAHGETKARPTFLLHGLTICELAWREVHGIKIRRYQAIKMKLRKTEGKEQLCHKDAREGQTYERPAFIFAKLFMKDYIKTFGDDQPDVLEVHLPCCVTKKFVYMDYKLHCINNALPQIKLKRFYQIWKSQFPHVKVRKFQKMTQCTECANFKEAFLRKPTGEEAKKLELKRKVHLTLQRLLREKYYDHRIKAAKNPSTYVSLIIDNMDQSKTNLPRYPFSSKADTGLSKLHHHVTGVLSHGTKQAYTFTWTDQLFTDCNVTLNCLIAVLHDIARKNGGGLPPTLFIQADNSAKDNKNNYVLMFLAMLVKADIVKKVKLNFLMVGHTHEDVDQLFSRISVAASKTSAVTLPDLEAVIKTSVTPPPKQQHLSHLWDLKEIATSEYKLEGFHDVHCFKITKKGSDVLLEYKDWQLETHSYSSINITHAIPEFRPPNIAAHNHQKFSNIIDSMIRDLPKWQQTGRFTKANGDWWKDYLQSLQGPPMVPIIPMPQNLGQFMIPRKENQTIDENLSNAINKHITKLQKKSIIRLKKR